MCPLDQKHIDSSHIEEPPKYILDYVSDLRIRCDFQEFGCKEVVQLNRVKLHRLNCEFHPERKVKCNECGIETEKLRFKDHNCISILKNRLDLMSQQLEEVKRFHWKEISTLRTQIQRRDREREQFRHRLYGTEGANERPMISFSCITDSQSGTHEMIFIQTINLTLKCEANMLTKIGQIKYTASSIAHFNTNEFSLFSNGIRLEDHNYLSYYNIHNGSICHLLPNEIYITFDCVDIRQILGFSVHTSHTIQTIIGQLNSEISKLIPEQLFLYLKQCSCSLYFNDIKLEETYELSNYDVLLMRTLKYSNRLPIDV